MESELSWGLPVILYLYLAGVGAGAVTTSASILLRGSGHYKLATYGALLGPLPVMLGVGLIIFELGRPFRMLNLFKLINLSPMSIGSWFLIVFMLLSVLYAITFLPKLAALIPIVKHRVKGTQKLLAWIMVPTGIGVAIYTGIMLGAMPSRPFWNSPILALLFLVSALSTGVALIMLVSAIVGGNDAKHAAERRDSAYLLTATDTMLIGLELLVIFLFVMFAQLTIGNVKYAVAIILPGGELATIFWLGVVALGLVGPGLIELIYVAPKLLFEGDFRVPKSIEISTAVAVLGGGFLLRYVVVEAGQLTGPIGL